jgi:hypothetical protein
MKNVPSVSDNVSKLSIQTSIAILTSTHSKVRDTNLSPGQSSANLMIAGVQELHGSTFDATVMQTDPSEGRNQLRSDRVSAYRNSTGR